MIVLLDRGVDGLMTDRTDILRDVLARPRPVDVTRGPSMSAPAARIADLDPLGGRREQKAWYWYDWANSAFATTIGTVLFGPYLIASPRTPRRRPDQPRLGPSRPAARARCSSTSITVSTILSALLLPPLGAVADRTANKKDLLGLFAWAGSAFAALIFFVTGDNWQLGAVGDRRRATCASAPRVVNDSILPLISDRGRARPRLLARLGLRLPRRRPAARAQPGRLPRDDALGLDRGPGRPPLHAVGGAVVGRLHAHPVPAAAQPPARHVDAPPASGVLRASFGQLAATLRDLRSYPVALTFLLAYLFFNDGIQTVIASASVFGAEELGFEPDAC